MNTTTTRWLLLLALGLFAFILVYERNTNTTEEQVLRAESVFPDFDPAAVSSLEVRRASNLVVRLARTGDRWQYQAPIVYPAQSLGVEKLLVAVAHLQQRAYISSQEVLGQTNHLAAFGLERPTAVVVVHCDTTRTELRLGSHTLLGNQVYLQVVGRDGIFAIDDDFLKTLPATVNDWRDTGLIVPGLLKCDRIEVRRTNGFEVSWDPATRVWQMSKPLHTSANNRRIDDLLHQLEFARVEQFVSDDLRADLDAYGLQPPEREIVFGKGTNDLLVLQLGQGPTNNPNQIFVRTSTHSNVVLVARSTFEPWLSSFRDFCDRRLMVFKPDAVSRIEARGDEAFALDRQTNGSWTITSPQIAPADPVLVLEMFANLAELEFDRFENEVVSDFSPYGLAPARRHYAVLSSTTNAAGTITNSVLAQVDFGNPTDDQKRVMARRSQENSVLQVVDFGRLPRAGFELRDRRLWEFSTNDIISITIEQNGRTRQLLRAGPLKWAHGPGSEGMINNFTMEEAAYQLGRLRAARWVARGEDKLGPYGIPAMDHRVTVELLPAEKPRRLIVRFGRLAPSQNPYASVELDGQSTPVIFECTPELTTFINGNLTAPPPPGSTSP